MSRVPKSRKSVRPQPKRTVKLPESLERALKAGKRTVKVAEIAGAICDNQVTRGLLSEHASTVANVIRQVGSWRVAPTRIQVEVAESFILGTMQAIWSIVGSDGEFGCRIISRA